MEGRGYVPSESELLELREAFSRDPLGSYVSLGLAYLALGRPQEAVEVGARGLSADPDNVDGRLMVARAFAAMHQWREAQAELLKVVKAHRNHTDGFRLLGEVLMRRDDFDRALPVLSHAQNLAPADPDVLELLRHARAREPLGPPPPVPQPVEPVSAAPPTVTPNGTMDKAPRPKRASMAPQGSRRAARPSGPVSQVTGETVRPRVVSNHKPVGVAQASLRMSAAAGEQHLPSLLSLGLLEIPNVHAARIDYHVTPVKRWGRSMVQLLMTLGLVAGLSGVGTIGYFWFMSRTTALTCESELNAAMQALDSGGQEALVKGVTQAKSTAEKCPDSSQAAAVLARNEATRALLFGDGRNQMVLDALEKAKSTAADDPDYLIGRTAAAVAGIGPDAANLKALVEPLGALPSDNRIAGWMLGRLHLALGNRSAAKKALEAAHADGMGAPLASLDLGNFYLDEGETDVAIAIFDALLKREPAPKLANIARGLAYVERGENIEGAMRDLNVNATGLTGQRVEAQRDVVLAGANLILQDYEGARELLKNADKLSTPRWVARAGHLRLALGELEQARSERQRIALEMRHPVVRTLDAEIAWYRGKPREAERLVGDANDMRAHLVRGKALFDRRRYKAASKEFEAARKLAPEHTWALIWSEAGRIVTARDAGKRETAESNLRKLVLQTNDKAARLVQGEARLAIDEPGDARRTLESSLDDLTDEEPNTLLVRSRVALARAYIGEGKYGKAEKEAEAALADMKGFAPAKDALCQALAFGESSRAREVCGPLVDKSPSGDVLAAWAVLDRDNAESLLRRAQKKNAAAFVLRRSIKKVDKKLFDTLGVSKR